MADAMDGVNFISRTLELFQNDAVMDNISLLGQMGNHLIDLSD
jgi:hypothetical protein